MRVLRTLLTAAVPLGIAVVAFLNANAVNALVGGTMTGTLILPSVAVAHAADFGGAQRPSAHAILERNAFDHVTGSLLPRSPPGPDDLPRSDGDPKTAPLCEGVRPLVVVGDEDQQVAFASLEYGGKRLLRRRGGDVGEARVAYVGRDRVWLEGRFGLCQALLFGASPPPAQPQPKPEVSAQSPFEIGIGKQIVKTGPNEYAIDRSAVDRILEAQQELMKHKMVPEKDGVRLFGVKPGSVLALLGIENGDRLETINGVEVTSPEKMLEAYARLRSGASDKLQIHLTRAGKPLNLDYVIR